MSKMKDDWIDQFYASEAHWVCPSCKSKNISNFVPPAIDLTSDSARDMNASDETEVECGSCGKIYDAHMNNSVFGLEFSLVSREDSDLAIDVKISTFEDDWEPSDSPSDEFFVAMEGLRSLMTMTSPSRYDDQLLNRLIFTNIITSIETYLKDTLLNLIEDDASIRLRLFESENVMKKTTVLISKILTDPDLPKKHLTNHIKPLSFHNFPKVDNLYKIAIAESIYVDQEHGALLCKAKDQRHHCVHRNGKDEAGVKLRDFTPEYLERVANAADALVNKIDHILAARFFENLDDED